MLKIKNKCIATIYDSVLKLENIKKIHKKLLEMTINNKKLFVLMAKEANKAKKIINLKKTKDENAALLLLFFNKEKINSKSKKIINHELNIDAEEEKMDVIDKYINNNRNKNTYIYLASSHNDCAEDHKPYQGKLYYDNKAPTDLIDYCEEKGMKSIQWVMDSPAWFITRPNCRHFFTGIPTDKVLKYSKKELQRRYKTHSKEGNRKFKTPAKIAVEEYEDRLSMLKALYAKHPTINLKREIEKIRMLLKKWKNNI